MSVSNCEILRHGPTCPKFASVMMAHLPIALPSARKRSAEHGKQDGDDLTKEERLAHMLVNTADRNAPRVGRCDGSFHRALRSYQTFTFRAKKQKQKDEWKRSRVHPLEAVKRPCPPSPKEGQEGREGQRMMSTFPAHCQTKSRNK